MTQFEMKQIKRAIQSCKEKIKHHYEHTRNKVSNAIRNEYTKIAALEKQIPQKPIKKNPICYSRTKDGVYSYAYDCYCPNCGVNVNKETHHCPCGQALDWRLNDDTAEIK